ncbi:MAG TPA: FecR domain-containing protein, partial [Verrucomicrobiae bacterium]|nr:FecR domain-containing protein [Verrucomicrobiae bacterium]
ARAEIEFDGDAALRLAGATQVRLASDDSTLRDVQLAAGTVQIAIVARTSAAIAVDTPSVTIRALQPGDYRVSVAADGSTLATSRRGEAWLVTPKHLYPMKPGTTFAASGSAEDPQISTQAPIPFDRFDDFNAARDKAMAASLAGSAPPIGSTLAPPAPVPVGTPSALPER